MKGNIKKMTVLVIIGVVAMFSAVAMASGDRDGKEGKHHGIQGEYAVTGSNNCVLSGGGTFTNPAPGIFTPQGAFQVSNGFIEGVYTFHVDGSGSFTGLTHTNTYPALGPSSPTSALGELSYAFTYTVADDGLITFTQDGACSYQSCAPVVGGNCTAPYPTYLENIPKYGVISPDGMNLTVTCGVPIILSVLKGPAAPSGNKCPDSLTPDLAGPQLSCNISLMGFKVLKKIQLPTF